MLVAVHPKLPMRDKARTLEYYTGFLGFRVFGSPDYPDYLMLEKDAVQLHFFAYPDLNPADNYGQVYIRCSDIEQFYATLTEKSAPIHPAGSLAMKPWGQREFSMLDPDNNLLTFGQAG